MSASAVQALAPVDVAALEARARALRDDVGALVVASEAGKVAATDVLARIQTFQREAESERVRLVRPLNDHVKLVNDAFKRVLRPVDEADRALRDKVLAYNREQQRLAAQKAAEAEALRFQSAARLQEAEKAEAKGETGVAEQLLTGAVASEQGAKAAQAEAVLPSRHVVTGAGSSTVRKEWTFTVTDRAQVPREYLILDERRVREAIRGGVRVIPGLDIFQEEKLAVRA